MCSGTGLPPLGGGCFGLYSHEVVLKSGVRRVPALGMLGSGGGGLRLLFTHIPTIRT